LTLFAPAKLGNVTSEDAHITSAFDGITAILFPYVLPLISLSDV
jgi:hypothetical protein